jgi:hypothetical protein
MKKIYAIDCETKPFNGKREEFKPLVWGIYDGEKDTFFSFENTDNAIQFIKNNAGLYYAHNGGKFDWFFMLKYIAPNYIIFNGELTEGHNKRLLYINGRLVQFFLGESELRDSFPILPVALRYLGAKSEIDYNKLNNFERHKTEIVAYLKQDCVVLWNAVRKFHEMYGNYLTIPSAALAAWRGMSGHKSREYTDTDPQYDALHRQHYFGGRVQSLVTGKYAHPFRVYDINSAYPFAMIHTHPWGYETRNVGPDQLCGHGFISLKCKSLGGLPWRAPDGSTDFPSDGQLRRFDVTGWEFLACSELGLIRDAIEVKAWQHIHTIDFKQYVEKFYTLKQSSEKDSFEYVTSKLFLNSLYGKYGQNWTEFSEHLIASADCPAMIPVEIADREGVPIGRQNFAFHSVLSEKTALYDAPKYDGSFFNVAIAASITGFVRAYILRAIKSSKKPLYVDTDSIACKDFSERISPNLGDWKKEGEFCCGLFCGKKLYYFCGLKKNPDKSASKGVRLVKRDFLELVAGKEVTYHPLSPVFGMRTGRCKIVPRKVRIK